MTPKQKQALELHTAGLSYAAIGTAMGVSRQTALEHVRKAQAFAAQAPDKTLQQTAFDTVNPYAPDLPTTVAVRTATDLSPTGGHTPSSLASTVAAALQNLDTPRLFSLYKEMERKDANYRSVKETRINQVCQLPDRVEAVSTRLRDKKVAEWVEAFVAQDAFQDLKEGLMEGVFEGAALVATSYAVNSAGDVYLADVAPVEGRHLVFSRTDGRTMFVAPATQGASPQEVLPGQAAMLYAKRGGVAVGGGLALVGLWAFVLKWLAKRDWASLSAVFGKPARIGKYKPGTAVAEVQAMRAALSQLGSQAAALIPETMSLEFLKDSTAGASADMFERFIRYCDEQVAKLVLGASLTTGTSNTGSGGSQALGVVHNELRYDIMRADARRLARALREHVLRVAVELQFGAGTPVPRYEIVVEEPEDLVALASVAEKGKALGLPLSKRGIAKRLGLPLAAEDDPDDHLQPPAAAPSGAAYSACLVHTPQLFAATGAPPRDAIDALADEMLSDWQQVSADADAALAEAAANSTSLADLRTLLSAVAESGDVEQLKTWLATQRTKARLAGDQGAEV